MGRKRAPVWQNYELSTDGQGKQIASCKRCRSQLVADGTDGTSHVTRHLKSCTGRQDGAPPAPPLAASTESSNCSKAANWGEAATADLARMVALHGYDPSFVEDSYFRSFVRQLNTDFQVPSRAALEDICDGVCDEASGVLRSELERTSGMVNLAIDTVETATGKVLYAACHFIDEDWNRRLMILDVKIVVPEGMGSIPHCDTEYHLDECIVDEYDIAYSSNTISTLLISQRVFSVVVGNINHLNEDLEVARYETAYNHNDTLQMVLSCFLNNIDPNFVDGIYWYSPLDYEATRQERRKLYSQFGLDHLQRYDEKWISLYFCLEIHHHRKKERMDISSDIRKSEELMRNVFAAIYCASKTISDPNHQTSNIVRELFKVREALQSSLADASGDEASLYVGTFFEDDVVGVLEEAIKEIDESIEKVYLQWSIPLVLDPRYKIRHIQVLFLRAFNSEATREYIANIRKEIKDLFVSFSIDGGETSDAAQIHEKEITDAQQLELDLYLEDPLVKDTDDFDILSWWKLNSSKYPTIAMMARAALAMPTCNKLSSEQMSQITSIFRGYTKGMTQGHPTS